MKKNQLYYYTHFILIVLITVINLSCDSNENSVKDNTALTYEIYYRWTEDLDYPSNSNASHCDESISAYYTNSHPDIPNNAVKNQYYIVSPGSFTVDLGNQGGSATNNISAPAKGYRRYYTHMIKKYSSSLNRCVILIHGKDALTYVDEPK